MRRLLREKNIGGIFKLKLTMVILYIEDKTESNDSIVFVFLNGVKNTSKYMLKCNVMIYCILVF